MKHIKKFKGTIPFVRKRAVSPDYMAHKDEPTDRYAAYLAEDSMKTNDSDNARNLFDDSDTEDRRWTQMVRRYLNRNR